MRKTLLALAASVLMAALAHAQTIPQIIVPNTGVTPPNTPAGMQQLISGTPWVNGRALVGGPNWRDNYQIVQNILSGMGTWSAQGAYTPNNALPLTGGSLNGPLGLTSFSLGAAQTAVGQLGQITSPYTTGMLNTQNDILRVQVGNVGPQYESGFTNPVTAGITSIMRVPPGTYTGGNTAGDAAIQAIIISDSNPTTPGGNYKSGVAVDAIGGIGTSGAFVESVNGSIVNCSTFSGCTGNSGLDISNFTDAEFDTNLYCRTAFVSGACPTAGMPTGPVFGVISQLNATTSTTHGNETAFRVNGSPNLGGGAIPWKTGFESISGAATVGISLGAISTAPNSNSQPINLTAVNPSGAAAVATLVEDNAGILRVAAQGMGLGPLSGAAGSNSMPLTFTSINSAGTATIASMTEDNAGTLHLGAQGVDVAIAGYGMSTAASMIAGGFRETLTTPATSSAACTAGAFTDDANYHYVCTAANTWKRVALTTF